MLSRSLVSSGRGYTGNVLRSTGALAARASGTFPTCINSLTWESYNGVRWQHAQPMPISLQADVKEGTGGEGFSSENGGGEVGSEAAAEEGSEGMSATAAVTADEASSLTPRQIVQALDEYIVGQEEAKRAIAISLRNRWRRQRIDEELKPEVIPKNILMVGPTGVGKTEIARRLAKFAKAPFVKVEATKFTEVGYHGRDVESIIKDLVETSAKLCREIKQEEFAGEIQRMVEEKLLDSLTGSQSQETTRAEFRKLLREGQLDELDVEIDVPRSRGGGNDNLEFSVGGGQTITVDPMDLFSKLQGRNNRNTEKRKMKVKDARPIMEEAELDKKLSQIDWQKDAVELAEQHGIVFIDEVDKIVSGANKYTKGGDASAEGVQRDLLPLIEGTTVEVKKFGNVKTDYMLFVASGAFQETKTSDMLAELQGRLPIRVELKGLTAEDMYKVLTEPKANLIVQQKALLKAEGIELDFTEDAIRELAEQSAEMNKTVENIGARRLHTVIERVLEEISFDASDMESGSKLTIDQDYVQDKLRNALKRADIKKFIL
eukprot:gb/GECG01013816.1/.p1 GENE.gb/GECG01013816.1/~~gb/GECG01013816.1/.p1  ORF type:complete len:547 (+),score=108.10 gb/GECG01013816.1/:1-1641(+)